MTKERIPPSAVCSICQALVYSICQTINLLDHENMQKILFDIECFMIVKML